MKVKRIVNKRFNFPLLMKGKTGWTVVKAWDWESAVWQHEDGVRLELYKENKDWDSVEHVAFVHEDLEEVHEALNMFASYTKQAGRFQATVFQEYESFLETVSKRHGLPHGLTLRVAILAPEECDERALDAISYYIREAKYDDDRYQAIMAAERTGWKEFIPVLNPIAEDETERFEIQARARRAIQNLKEEE